MVRLHDVGGRRPNQLSGGQRQRVALARAIVNRPRVLLLDEPLGALDLKLREEMQVELKQIQQEVAITFVYVTHDQDEALSMSDRIAVFNRGKIEQVGTPADVYERPLTEFVAGFVGVSNMLERDGRPLHDPPGEDPHPGRGRRRRRACTPSPGPSSTRATSARRPASRSSSTQGGRLLATRLRTSRHQLTRTAICAGVRCASDGARIRPSPSAAYTPRNRRTHEAPARVRRSGDRTDRLALAACGSDSSGGQLELGPSFKVPDIPVVNSIGAGEGKLNIVVWPGYAEDGSTDKSVDWVTPFEKETQLQRRTRRSRAPRTRW